MRALPGAGGEERLRVAVVRGGVVLEERTLEHRENVTIGPTERSTFVLPDNDLAQGHLLFEVVGGTYHLRCPSGARGRVAAAAGGFELGAGPPPPERLALDKTSRGRLVIGETTLLFQMVRARPGPAPASLPSSLRGGLADDIDWPTTLIAAFSFLVHFGAVGTLWSDWTDPVIDEEVRVAELVESMRALPAPPRLELSIESPAEAPSSAAQAPAPGKATRPGRAGKGPGARGGAGQPAGRMSDAAASALAAELRQIDLAVTGALRGRGGATDTVITEGNVPSDLLEGAARSAAGAGRGGVAGLSLATGEGGVVPPGAVRGGGLIGNVARGTPGGVGSAAAVKRPAGSAAVSPPLLTGGDVPNAGGVVAGLRGGFMACYRRALDVNPDEQGSARITAKIGPNGEVLSATPSGVVGLSPGLLACVAGRVAGARFDPPSGGFALVVIPVKFVHQ